ncbi:MAG: hypothetical protein ACOCUI_04090, partial [bacterium]
YNIKEKVICKIEVLGDILNNSDMKKSCTNKIKILEILTKEQILSISNVGIDNTGVMNGGNLNSGDLNSGNLNSGDRNSGNLNSGDLNSGNGNSGDRNSGGWNSGDWNSGDLNSGNGNSGDKNSGDLNSGNSNSGNLNSGDRNSGLFNSNEPYLRLFNKPSKMTFNEFYDSKYWEAICSSNFILTEWIYYSNEEKKNDKAKDLIGGYLKIYNYKDAAKKWWNNMTKENQNIIKSMPNFDAKIFEEITGIKV